jgi:hypothetical protein
VNPSGFEERMMQEIEGLPFIIRHLAGIVYNGSS